MEPTDDLRRPRSRHIYLLPNLLTTCGLFSGFYAILAAANGQFVSACVAVFVAALFDGVDGRVARLTGTSSEFGVQFDSLADVISFGVAPAILSFSWGLAPLGRLGWAAGFLFVTAAALRLARFNIQSAAGGDKRYFVGMPSPAAAAVPAATVFAYPAGFSDYRAALPALAMVIVPALLMVSTIRFRSFKTIDLQSRRPYSVLLLVAGGIMLITTHPQVTLVVMAYTYLMSAFIGMAISRFRQRDDRGTGESGPAQTTSVSSRGSAAS